MSSEDDQILSYPALPLSCVDVYVVALRPDSRVVVLAAALWKPVLPPGGPAGLHDPDHDERIPEPEGGFPALIIIIVSFSPLLLSVLLSFCCGFQQTVEGLSRCCRLYCVLSAGFLSCYYSQEEIEAKVQPTLNVPVSQVRQSQRL